MTVRTPTLTSVVKMDLRTYADQRYMKAYQSTKTLRGIDVDAAMMGFNIENLTAKQALM